ncbi:unnamed protein product, partial [Candidula unifasciata]
CKPACCYVLWRVLWAVYHTCWLTGNIAVASVEGQATVFKWFIYLSNWMYLLLTIECVFEAVLVVGALLKKPRPIEEEHLPWHLQLMWLLYTVSAVGAVVVAVWYWACIHKGKTLTPIRFNTHAIAAIYVILNMAFTRLPFRLLHFIYPVGTNQNGETYIYSILDWSRPGRTLIITSLSNFVFIPLVHLLLWTLSICFQKLHERIRKSHVVYSQGIDSLEAEEIDVH